MEDKRNKLMVDGFTNQNKNREETGAKQQQATNEINTIVNQEIGKEKQPAVRTENIYVMPDKFLPQSINKSLGGKQKIILAAIAFVLFLIIVVGVMLWIANRSITNIPENNQPNNTEQNDQGDEESTVNHDEKIINDLTVMNSLLSRYFADFRSYPSLLSDLSQYLNEIPRQPNGSAYQYELLKNGSDFGL